MTGFAFLPFLPSLGPTLNFRVIFWKQHLYIALLYRIICYNTSTWMYMLFNPNKYSNAYLFLTIGRGSCSTIGERYIVFRPTNGGNRRVPKRAKVRLLKVKWAIWTQLIHTIVLAESWFCTNHSNARLLPARLTALTVQVDHMTSIARQWQISNIYVLCCAS